MAPSAHQHTYRLLLRLVENTQVDKLGFQGHSSHVSVIDPRAPRIEGTWECSRGGCAVSEQRNERVALEQVLGPEGHLSRLHWDQHGVGG